MTELRKEVKQKDIVIDKLETDLKRIRVEPFLEEEFEGVRKYDQELIQVLQETGSITSDELVQRLGIDPSESDLMQGLDKQLQQLEGYGLIDSTARAVDDKIATPCSQSLLAISVLANFVATMPRSRTWSIESG